MFDSICGLIDIEPIDSCDFSIDFEMLLQDLECAINSATWCFEPITKTVNDEDTNRLGEVVMGPIFTSIDYSWPISEGFPMAPLIQLDLQKASEMGSVPLGDGLLQVWMPHKSTKPYIRVVPRSEVVLTNLSDILDIPDEMQPLQKRYPQWNEKLKKYESAPAYQIVGYSSKRFTMQIHHLIRENYEINGLTKNKLIVERVKDLDEHLKPLIKSGPRGFNPDTTHLFGTFRECNYAANEKPNPLFCFEEDFGCIWGSEGGNAQIFYEFDELGNVVFTFYHST